MKWKPRRNLCGIFRGFIQRVLETNGCLQDIRHGFPEYVYTPHADLVGLYTPCSTKPTPARGQILPATSAENCLLQKHGPHACRRFLHLFITSWSHSPCVHVSTCINHTQVRGLKTPFIARGTSSLRKTLHSTNADQRDIRPLCPAS